MKCLTNFRISVWCVFLFLGPGPFELYTSYSALDGIIDPDYDYPTDADGVDTFYFGQDSWWTYTDCENICESVSFKVNNCINFIIFIKLFI